VGDVDWNPAIDVNHGRAAIYGPPDGFWPETGIIAEGAMDEPGWVMARIDLSRVARSRADGAVLPFAHWPESEKSRLV
jgi:predicted amidohydrolase